MNVGVNRTRQNLTFNVTPDRYIIGRVLGMGDACDILFNDRTFIKIGRYIMGRRPDQFDTAFIGLPIRVGALETWQE